MLQSELLIKAINILNDAEIEYMLTGSVASSLQGEPRATHDIDIVINIDHRSVPVLLKAFTPPQFYISEDAIYDAIKYKSMFNVIDTTNANKIDSGLLLLSHSINQDLKESRKKISLALLLMYQLLKTLF